jgi:hypothetical protein
MLFAEPMQASGSPVVRDVGDIELIGLLAIVQQLEDRAAALNARQAERVISDSERHALLLHALRTAHGEWEQH